MEEFQHQRSDHTVQAESETQIHKSKSLVAPVAPKMIHCAQQSPASKKYLSPYRIACLIVPPE